jgi:GNAT superfamily N-acetyltransferase
VDTPSIEIREEPPSTLAQYAQLSIAFEVRAVLDVEPLERGLGSLRLVAAPVAEPYVKDYDADPMHHPTQWPARFDMRRWGILAAWRAGARVGGAVIAWDTDVTRPEESRRDLALLWDLRVAPHARGLGVGRMLFRAAEWWATSRGARWLQAETQNVNVPACRFYARQGCTLGAVHRFAYPALPHETQLLWYKALHSSPRPGALAPR